MSEEKDRGQDESGNLGIVLFSPPPPYVSVVPFQSLVKFLQGLCVSPELKWILWMLICTQKAPSALRLYNRKNSGVGFF